MSEICEADDIDKVVPTTESARRVVELVKRYGKSYVAGELSLERGSVITGSEISAILMENRFETPGSVFFKKVFGMREKENEAMAHGRRFEPVAISKFRSKTNARIFFVGFMRHERYSFLGGTFDALAIMPDGEGVLVEVKCPLKRSIGRYVPDYYIAQVQTYLEISGLPRCAFVQYKPSYFTPQRKLSRPENLSVVWENRKPHYYETRIATIWTFYKTIRSFRVGVYPLVEPAIRLIIELWRHGRRTEEFRRFLTGFKRMRSDLFGVRECVLVELEQTKPAFPTVNNNQLVVVMDL